MEHTKGPWKSASFVDAGGVKNFTVSTEHGSHVADVYPLTLSAKANAKLIAAAPDLLEALLTVKTTLDAFLPGAFATRSIVDNAISKAKGL